MWLFCKCFKHRQIIYRWKVFFVMILNLGSLSQNKAPFGLDLLVKFLFLHRKESPTSAPSEVGRPVLVALGGPVAVDRALAFWSAKWEKGRSRERETREEREGVEMRWDESMGGRGRLSELCQRRSRGGVEKQLGERKKGGERGEEKWQPRTCTTLNGHLLNFWNFHFFYPQVIEFLFWPQISKTIPF